jgi:hypothetical protein
MSKQSKGEQEIRNWLTKKEIPFVFQKVFNDCKNINHLPFDFAIVINDKYYCIEYQGKHHYDVNDNCMFGASDWDSEHKKVILRDKIKYNYCKKENIPFLIIPYWDFDKIDELLTEFLRV